MKNLSQLAAGAFVATTTMLSAPAIAQEQMTPCLLSPDTIKILTSRLARHPEFHSLVCDTRTGAEIVITLQRSRNDVSGARLSSREADLDSEITERVKNLAMGADGCVATLRPPSGMENHMRTLIFSLTSGAIRQ